MKTILFTSILLTVCIATMGQNGKIIQQKDYKLSDSSIAKIRKINPEIDAVVEQINFYDITYLSDGLKVKGYMAIPKKKGNYPCVIFNRGGNRDAGALDDGQLGRIMGVVASWGYVVVGSQYRGNMGGEGKDEFGGRDVNDVLNMIPMLSTVEYADTSRIGMYGWSRGGMMTYMALTKTNQIKAAVIGSGMANAFKQIAKRPEINRVFSEVIPGYNENKDSVIRSHSAVFWTDKLAKNTPLLLMSGSSDWRVLPEEQFEMMTYLYARKHPFRFMFFEGGQHSLIEHSSEVNNATRAFLDKYVRDKEQWPNMEPHGN